MRIHVDVTEPGALIQTITQLARGIEVRRSILHKREGQGASMRENHPLYGLGADYVITDDADVPLAAIERKTLEDLARSLSLPPAGGSPRVFRQIKDLTAHPMPILLLEGQPSLLYRRLEPAILGFQFWCAREGVAIIYASTPAAAARAITQIARKIGGEAGIETAPPPADAPAPEAPSEATTP